MSELWKDIDGFDGLYQISSLGRVRSFALDKINGRLLKPQPFPNGYLFIMLGRCGGSHLIHRLVAKAFIPGDHELQVNHLDGVRANNQVENLEWLSCSDNHKHSYRELSRKVHALTRETILVKRGEELVFPSLKAAVRYLGTDTGSAHKARRTGRKCRGYEIHASI